VKPKLTPEEMRVLRREVHGKGGLVAAGFISITPAARKLVAQDDERIERERKAGALLGGQPAHKKGGKK
jgi:hypothetical protein